MMEIMEYGHSLQEQMMMEPGTPEQSPQNSVDIDDEVDDFQLDMNKMSVVNSVSAVSPNLATPPVFQYKGGIGSLNSNANSFALSLPSNAQSFANSNSNGTGFHNSNSSNSKSQSQEGTDSSRSSVLLEENQMMEAVEEEEDEDALYENVAGSVDGLTPNVTAHNTPEQEPAVPVEEVPPLPVDRISSIQSDDSDLNLMYGRPSNVTANVQTGNL